MFAYGMPPEPGDGPRTGCIFCAASHPGCRQMVIVSNLGKALAAKKLVVAGQAWKLIDDRWHCDRCAAGWAPTRI
jgi:hypothetical protein